MLITSKNTKSSLVRAVLASSVLVASMGYMTTAGATINVGGANSTTTALAGDEGLTGYNFDQAGAYKLTVNITNQTIGKIGATTDSITSAVVQDNTLEFADGKGIITLSGGITGDAPLAANKQLLSVKFLNTGDNAVNIGDVVKVRSLVDVNTNGLVNFAKDVEITAAAGATVLATGGTTEIGGNFKQVGGGQPVNIVGGTVNFKGFVATGDAFNLNGGTVKFTGSAGVETIGAALVIGAAGSTVVMQGPLTQKITADTNFGANNPILTFDLQNSGKAGNIAVTGNATVAVGNKLNIINVNPAFYPANAATVSQLITSTGGGGVIVVPTLGTMPVDNLFVKYAVAATANTSLDLTVTRTAPTGLDSNIAGAAGVFAGLDNVKAPGQTELLSLADNLMDLGSTAAIAEALQEIAPLVDGGAVASVLGNQNTTFDLFSQRAAELRAGLGNNKTGYSAGHMNDKGHGTWVKVFGSHADQNKRNGIQGYRAETWGMALGADMMITEKSLVGISGSWASADVNHDSNGGGTDVKSYQASLYGSWNIKTPLYMNWMASVAKNKYDTTRNTIVGNFKQTTIADFDGMQYGARAELGYVYGQEAFHVTPSLALTYSHLDFDEYREKGTSTANQVIAYDDVNALLAGAGVKFSYDYDMKKSLVVPEVHANIAYDVIGDEQKANARFVQFGPTYETSGASAVRANYNAGASLTTYGDSGLGLSLSYDYNWKRSYHAHAGFIKVRYEW